MRKSIRAGIEIEAIINGENNTFEIGEYHDGEKLGDSWRVEDDGSLIINSEFRGVGAEGNLICNSKTAEFVSKCFHSKSGFFKGLKEFKGFFKGDLPENLNFNTSCGCHIHIGLNGKGRYYNKISFEILKEMRELFFKLVRDSTILSNIAKAGVTNQYFRRYAEEIFKTEYTQRNLRRNSEFNIRSDVMGMGLEWRSFNLNGVKSWAEFDEMFKIAWVCIEFLFKKRTKGYMLKREAIRIKRQELSNLKKWCEKPITLSFIESPSKKEEVLTIKDLPKEVSINYEDL